VTKLPYIDVSMIFEKSSILQPKFPNRFGPKIRFFQCTMIEKTNLSKSSNLCTKHRHKVIFTYLAHQKTQRSQQKNLFTIGAFTHIQPFLPSLCFPFSFCGLAVTGSDNSLSLQVPVDFAGLLASGLR